MCMIYHAHSLASLNVRLFFQVSAMICGLLPLSVDAMALGEVPFLQADVQLNQLQESLGSVGKV